MQFQNEHAEKQKQISELLTNSLQRSYVKIDLKTIENVKSYLSYVEDKTYKLFTQENSQYLNFIWQRIVEKHRHFKNFIIPKMEKRFSMVYQDVLNNQLKVEEKVPVTRMEVSFDFKGNKLNTVRQQSNQIRKKIDQINGNLTQMKESQIQVKTGSQILYLSEEKRKEHEEKIRKLKQERQAIHKRIKERQKKEEEELIKKQNQTKEQLDKAKKQKRDQSIKKQQELHNQRKNQKELRQKRNSQYIRLKKIVGEKPPLFERLEKDYKKRYVQLQIYQRQRLLDERKSLFEHIDEMKLEEHEKFYEKLKEQKERNRRQKLAKQEEQQRSRIKFHSSFELKKQPDLKQQQKVQAKEKVQKMNQYKQMVLERYKPKVDEEKRKQLLDLIEEMDLSKKKIKKKQLENGEIVYEEIKLSDPRIRGIQYLEQVKQLTAQMKQNGKRKNSLDLNPVIVKKPINYLEEMRSKERPRKTGRILTGNMSYEQKVKKVELQTQKLNELAKQKQMKLKFGKFKTSQEILSCKEEIDQHYLQIVRMKLDLANEGKHNLQ